MSSNEDTANNGERLEGEQLLKSSSFLREPRERRPWDGEDIGGEGEVGSEGRIINWKKPFKHIFQQSSEAYERQKQAREETSRGFEEKRWARQNEIEERKLGMERKMSAAGGRD